MFNAEQEIWGTARLQEALERNYKRSMILGLKNIIHSSRSWQEGGVFGDDVALVGLELTGESREKGEGRSKAKTRGRDEVKSLIFSILASHFLLLPFH